MLAASCHATLTHKMKARDSMHLRFAFRIVEKIAAVIAATLVAAASFAAETGSADTGMPGVVKGKPAGINVGDCAPDFQLEPIEISADFKRWLGDKAPKSFEDKIMLSDFVGKAPIVLLFGSFT
jgi:hypothetical protein